MQVNHQRKLAAGLHRRGFMQTGVTIGAVAVLPRPQQLPAPAGWFDRPEYRGGRISERTAGASGTLRGRAPASRNGNYQRYA